MRIFVFGSSITSAYWNGAATYYRGIYKNLAALGMKSRLRSRTSTSASRTATQRIEYAKSSFTRRPHDIDELIALACNSDLVIKHSGVGADDALLESGVLDAESSARKSRSGMWMLLRRLRVWKPIPIPSATDPAIRFHLHLWRRRRRSWNTISRSGRGTAIRFTTRSILTRTIPSRRSVAEVRPGFRRQSLARSRAPRGAVLSARRRTRAGDEVSCSVAKAGAASDAAERALDRARGHRRSQPGELFGAHGAEHQSRIDGGSRILSADARLRSRGRRRVPHHRPMDGSRTVLRAWRGNSGCRFCGGYRAHSARDTSEGRRVMGRCHARAGIARPHVPAARLEVDATSSESTARTSSQRRDGRI